MTNQEIRAERTTVYKKRVRVMWGLWGAAMLCGLIFFLVLANSKDLPSTSELQNPKNNLATEVIAADGSVLGRFYVENRVKVRYDELPEDIVNALIATEDKRFHNHAGIDMEALGRVVKGIVTGNTSQGGGSTITQQLAKLQYSNRAFKGGKIQRMIKLGVTKFKEWITAVQLERQYTKEEIMTMYLNQFDFLYGAVGVKSAAETYFGKSQKDLNMEECAMLVGMLKNPSLYNPKKFPERAKKRREVVLKLMTQQKLISQKAYDLMRVKPIELAFSRKTHSEGIAPYFREELRSEVKQILRDLSERDGKEYNVHTDGLKIYTTIDPRMQEHAEAAMLKKMAKNQNEFWKEWKGKDPWTYGNLTKAQKKMRTDAFTKVLRETDRYGIHRGKHLGEILDIIEKSHSISLRDYDIQRMLDEEDDPGYLTKLKKKELVSAEKVSTYRAIMRDNDAWRALKSDWRKLQKAVDKDFKKKTKMRIFSYDNFETLEKDTVMTPWDSLRYIRMHLQSGVMAVDPRNGAIKAWVGGVNHKYFKFDHVNKSVERQVGSTFKPFVYATAISQQGLSPCSKVGDIPYTIHKGESGFELLKDWTPKNFGEYTGEEFTLYKGLEKSKNTVSAYLMKQIGSPQPVRELAHNMGIDVDAENAYGQPRVPKQPSICLGATDLSVYEMTGAYATFANNGFYQKPFFIEKIEDRNGVVIYQPTPERRHAMEEGYNYVMVDMLKRVAAPIQGKLKSEVGGKTGTTNMHADAWFMGIAPELVIGTWVGGDDRWIRFTSPWRGQGGILARPIFVDFLKRVEADSLIDYNPNKRFKRPIGELPVSINCDEVISDDGNGLEHDPFSNNGDRFGDEDDEEDGFGEATPVADDLTPRGEDDTPPPTPDPTPKPDDNNAPNPNNLPNPDNKPKPKPKPPGPKPPKPNSAPH